MKSLKNRNPNFLLIWSLLFSISYLIFLRTFSMIPNNKWFLQMFTKFYFFFAKNPFSTFNSWALV